MALRARVEPGRSAETIPPRVFETDGVGPALCRLPEAEVRFGEAAELWLAGPVAGLRPATRVSYANSIRTHLRPRFGERALGEIDLVAAFVRELRVEPGLAESSIATVLAAMSRTYRFASRRLGYDGENPVSLLFPSERPRPSLVGRRPIFEGQQLRQTLEASTPTYRVLFGLAALTGARVSGLCALRWRDADFRDLDDARIEFSSQLDRRGERRPMKTDGSARTVPVPRELALILARHKLTSPHDSPSSPLFATRSGRPLGQRNVSRSLRAAMRRAVDGAGQPTFPVLHRRDEEGVPVTVPRGVLPSMHSFRHTLASRALLAGESIDEVALLLGHRDANVTRAVYLHEISDARRRRIRAKRIAEQFRGELEAAGV